MSFKSARKAANMTQTEAAIALGVTQTAVANWEAGLNNPTAERLRRMAVIYRCTMEDLLKKDGRPT